MSDINVIGLLETQKHQGISKFLDIKMSYNKMTDITFIGLLETQKHIQELTSFWTLKCRITKWLMTFYYNIIQSCYLHKLYVGAFARLKNKLCSIFFYIVILINYFQVFDLCHYPLPTSSALVLSSPFNSVQQYYNVDRGVQLILAYSWVRPAILVAGKGRGGGGGYFYFFCFFTFINFSLYTLSLTFISSTISSISFLLSLGDDTKWYTRVDVSLNPNRINQYYLTHFHLW